MACNLETVKPTPSGHTSFRKATSPKPTQNSATNWLPSSQTSEPMGDVLIQSTTGTSHLFPPLRLMINIQGSASVLFFFPVNTTITIMVYHETEYCADI